MRDSRPSRRGVHQLRVRLGTIAHLELAWLAPSKLRRTAVVGSKKMVIYDDGSNEPVKVYDSGIAPPNPRSFGTHQLTYRTGDIVSPHMRAVEPIALQLNDFCWSIRTGETPRLSAQLGLAVVGMIEAAERGSVDGPDLGGRRLKIRCLHEPPGVVTVADAPTERTTPPSAPAPEVGRLRVLVITNMFPTVAEPWFGVFVSDQTADLQNAGVDVEVLAFDARSNRRAYLTAARRLRHALRDGCFDIVHAHYGLAGAVAATQRRVPVVTTFHGTDALARSERPISWWWRAARGPSPWRPWSPTASVCGTRR